jgi:cysteine desulfurase/selenocysteine lyase
MRNYRQDFADFKDKIWLNAASEGPLPKVAALSLNTVVEWKSLPYQLDLQRFAITQKSLKEVLGRLINVNYQDVILGNSASYGLHILANGFPWKSGDEIITMQNDFPTNILPWLALEEQGVKVIQVKPAGKVLMPEELKKNITAKTKLVCMSHVHSFSGYKLNVEEFGKICQSKGIIFVANLSQSLGSFPIDVAQLGADAVVCAGYKWMLGPYGTGFLWMKPELRQQLKLNQAYWQFMLSDEELQSEEPIKLNSLTTARKYDMFATANFFNYAPWRTSIEYLLDVKLDNIWKHNLGLIDQLIQELDQKKYSILSSTQPSDRSCLFVISHQDKSLNSKIQRFMINQGIYTAFWKGNIRVSPHIYNTSDEITRLCSVLNQQ